MKKIDFINSKNRDKLNAIFTEYGVKKAAVFGSAARGEAKKSSDIDILVEFGGEKVCWIWRGWALIWKGY